MVLSADQVKAQSLRFIKALQQRIRVERALLFGSYAYGQPREGSDIDLAIVSPDFAAMNRLLRLQFLEKIAWEANTHDIEPAGFTDTELRQAGNTDVLGEIRDRGVLIYSSSPELVLRENQSNYSKEKDTD
jgi:predicted nucleotidyltransferase